MKSLLTRFDVGITQYVQSFPTGLRPLMKQASFFGEPVIGGFLLICATIFAIIFHKNHEVQALVTAFVVLPVASIVKLYIKRTRPVTYVPTTRLKSHSFPSGHSYGSMLGLGLLAWISGSIFSLAISLVIAALLFLAITTIGISRIYLGAHFPSDVIGGWIMAWIILSVVIVSSGLS
jgi:undecaprenyl-diphosphatase